MKRIVIKLGGYALDGGTRVDDVAEDVAWLYAEGWDIIVTHGGGPQIDEALESENIPSKRIDGLRATSPEALEIVRSVLFHTVRPAIVESLRAHGVPASGISGETGRLLVAEPHARADELGRVGEVVAVTKSVISDVQRLGGVPVVSTIAAGVDGMAFNINADSTAAKLAGALEADVLVLLTNVDGIYANYPNSDSLMPFITAADLRELIPGFDGGMQPKAHACVTALEEGAGVVYVANGAEPHVIKRLILEEQVGTKVVNSSEQREGSGTAHGEHHVDVRNSVDSSYSG